MNLRYNAAAPFSAVSNPHGIATSLSGRKRLDVLLLASAYNGMVQRVHRELIQSGHRVSIELSADETLMIERANQSLPDIIICPFLKHRVPETIWRAFPCLIVHPGIEGDRGPSSLDWAITRGETQWGVTLLQADGQWDAGDIWGTREFSMRNASKGSLYRREVISGAVKLIQQALIDYTNAGFRPRSQNALTTTSKGRPHELMRQADRQIDWLNDTTLFIAMRIRAADGFPGVRDDIDGRTTHLFGAVPDPQHRHWAEPGTWLGQRDGALCRATRDGAIWIRQMKIAPVDGQPGIKLPAAQAVKAAFGSEHWINDLPVLESPVADEIRVRMENMVAYLEFDFYNGAMSTEQCDRLTRRLRSLSERDDIRVIVLMGGEDFWSNGIHLNCIEADADPANESWRNINAIDDLVREILLVDGKLTVAALRNNAGAGGAIMPLACDVVLAREGVVLNPHYQTMGLYGSEYWTYLLPRRVGATRAHLLVSACLPLLAREALKLEMIDQVLPEDWTMYHQALLQHCEAMARDEQFMNMLSAKKRARWRDEEERPLAAYRADELHRMKATFDDPGASYHRLRRNFVHKTACTVTPRRLLGDLGRNAAETAHSEGDVRSATVERRAAQGLA
jgi:putative two-component system hydrogenase maturation factor HypX/HoxX